MNISRLSTGILFYILIYCYVLDYKIISNAKVIDNQQQQQHIIYSKNYSKPIYSNIIEKNGNNQSIIYFYNDYTESIRKDLEIELNKFIIYLEKSIPNQYLYKPIYSRVKSIESMKRKEIKRSYFAGKKVHWFQIFDQCGISIIINPNYKTSFIIEKLKELELNGYFKIIEIERKSDLYGYRAYHFDIEFGEIKIEIQIRSVYEDIFNIISHDNYKENNKNLKLLLGYQSFLLYKAEMNQPTIE
ncbi:hypothetical protein ACTFIR_008618 [Dictyostelium discoideum]